MNAEPFSKEEVLAIHSTTIARFGGLDGVHDEKLLNRALLQPFQTFDGNDLYPSPIEKACRYAFGIISDHHFLDDNKSTGAALLGAYLRMSGVNFKPDHTSFFELCWVSPIVRCALRVSSTGLRAKLVKLVCSMNLLASNLRAISELLK